mgnify:CR=1 FL=1
MNADRGLPRALRTAGTWGFATVWVVPLAWVVWRSFRTDGGGGYSMGNFVAAWDAAPFPRYYLNTIVLAVGVLAVQVVTGTLAAYAFARMDFPLKRLLFALYLLQIMIPNEVLIFPNYETIADLGLVDTMLGIMLPYFLSAFGIFLLRQTFRGVPIEIEEAARLDGCNTLQVIWHFYVPLARPTYVAFGLVSVSHQWSNFLWPLVVTNSPDNRPLSLGMSLFAKTTESSAQWGELCAATLLVIAPLLIAFFIFQRQFVSSFMMSGIK